MHYDPYWRLEQLVEERERDRLVAQLPRAAWPVLRVRLRIRARLAQALVALATWLSPDIRQPTPALELARARRNGTA
jgi:hypothetical protein